MKRTIIIIFYLSRKQDDTSSNLDLSEARASLLSGDVVELTNASAVDSETVKLTWDVSKKKFNACRIF